MSTFVPNPLIPAKDAAKRVGYSADYIAKLARENVVVGERRGRAWFVDLDSVKMFSLQRAAEQRQRQEELRLERLAELARIKAAEASSDDGDEVVSSAFPTHASDRLQTSVAVALTAACFSCLMLFSGLVAVSYDAKLDGRALVLGAQDVGGALAKLFPFWFGADEAPAAVVAPVAPQADQGIVLLNADTTQAERERIEASFSDEVTVTFTDEDAGVITPVFVNPEEAESYQFVLVPINEQSAPATTTSP